jgi:hypothetical protein
MTDIKDRAREYLAEHSKYSEVFGQTFVAVDTLTAMVEFAEQETKELQAQIEKMKRHSNCKHRNEYNEFDPYSKVCQSCCNLEKWEFGEMKE